MGSLQSFFKDELRAILAVALMLLVLVGLSLAAQPELYKFDFQSASAADLASGSILVSQSTVYPAQVTGKEIEFGFISADDLVALETKGSDKTTKDALASSQPISFKISGLKDDSRYLVQVISGSNSEAVASGFRVGSVSAVIISSQGQFNSKSLVATPADGVLSVIFFPVLYQAWVVNGLTIQTTSQAVSAPASFALKIEPSSLTVKAGETGSAIIKVEPVGEYSSSITLAVSGVVRGMVVSLSPNVVTPPASATLSISAGLSLPPLTYQIVVKALGSDADRISKTAVLELVVAPGEQTGSAVPIIPPSQAPEAPEPATSVIQPLTPAELLQNAKILAVVQAATERTLLTRRHAGEISLIGINLRDTPVLQELPQNPNAALGLDTLRDLGTIKSVVDTAPALLPKEAPKPTFWSRVLSIFVSRPVF